MRLGFGGFFGCFDINGVGFRWAAGVGCPVPVGKPGPAAHCLFGGDVFIPAVADQQCPQLQDASEKSLSHGLVLVSGILLVAKIPDWQGDLYIDSTRHQCELVYRGMNRWWINDR